MKSLLFFTFFSLVAESSTLKVATSEFPPFQFTKDDKVVGIMTEIVENVVRNAGYTAEIKSYPWSRALKLGSKEPEMLIYSVIRSPKREKFYKWIGPITPFNIFFWKLKKREDIKFKSIEEAKNYKCGATSGDIKTDYLLKLGFVPGLNLEIVTSDRQNVLRLFAGKIDLMTQDDLSFRYIVEAEKLNFSMFEKMIYLEGSFRDLELAASLGTPDSVVEKLRTSLIAFKKTEKYYKIRNRLE